MSSPGGRTPSRSNKRSVYGQTEKEIAKSKRSFAAVGVSPGKRKAGGDQTNRLQKGANGMANPINDASAESIVERGNSGASKCEASKTPRVSSRNPQASPGHFFPIRRLDSEGCKSHRDDRDDRADSEDSE